MKRTALLEIDNEPITREVAGRVGAVRNAPLTQVSDRPGVLSRKKVGKIAGAKRPPAFS
jgi:hypothetical protein